MMLKTSSNKVNPYKNMFWFTFKRNFGIIILATIAFLLVCPSYMLINLNDMGSFFDNRSEYFSAWNGGFSFFCVIAASISVVGLNLLNFSFMFKRPASDFTDSLPITRAELFFSKILSGYALAMIPAVLSSLSLCLTALCFGFKGIALKVLINIIYVAVITSVCSAVSMLFIVASANVFDFLVSFVGINVGLLVAGFIVSCMFDELLIGYAGNSMWSILNAVSPLLYSFYGFAFHLYEESAPLIDTIFLLKNVGMTLLFAVVSLILYKKRKTESTGKAFAYKFMYVICAVLISFCSAFIFGAVFDDGIYYTSPIFYGFALIGGLISSVIYGVITYRGFKTIKKSLIIGAISFVIIPITMTVIKFDLTGFNKRIPAKNDIYSVTIEAQGTNIEYTDPTFAINLHKKIINTKNVMTTDDISGPNVHAIDINYTLKNKKTLKRTYWVYDEYISDELSQMLKSDERFDGLVNKLKQTKPQTVDFGTINYTGDEYTDTYLTYDEAIKFIAIYKNEAQKLEQKVAASGNYSYYNISWTGNAQYYHDDFYYDDSYTETKAFLDSLNLEERVQKYDDTAYVEGLDGTLDDAIDPDAYR